MTLPFKPHVLALLCSVGLLAAAGTLYVKSREPQTAVEPPTVAQAAPASIAVQPVPASYSHAQIDQWVAPVALYPDNLLSQVLMASTYPSNVIQAVQWSQDHPTMKGDAAVQAVANQPWDPSVKSLVAFPPLLVLMGENPPWVENLGDAFLAQPQDVMDSVQRLRAIAQQTGTLKSTPQQKVITSRHSAASAQPTATVSANSSTDAPRSSAQVIRIESTDPNVVYVPAYNPTVVYGSWPNTAYPPVYLPPPPGEQFADSFVKGFGFSLGVATTYALFSNIDWDDNDHHDDHHGDYVHNGDNININVNNFNHLTGQNLPGNYASWHHNPAWRGNIASPNDNVTQRFHQTSVPGGLSATQHQPADRNAQRQAAMTQLQRRTGPSPDAQSQQPHQMAQRNNSRGYGTTPSLKNGAARPPRLETGNNHRSVPEHPQRREAFQTTAPEQRQPKLVGLQANALSRNDIHSTSWLSQRERGLQSARLSGVSSEPGEHLSERRELRREKLPTR